jgi:hypothetical protein
VAENKTLFAVCDIPGGNGDALKSAHLTDDPVRNIDAVVEAGGRKVVRFQNFCHTRGGEDRRFEVPTQNFLPVGLPLQITPSKIPKGTGKSMFTNGNFFQAARPNVLHGDRFSEFLGLAPILPGKKFTKLQNGGTTVLKNLPSRCLTVRTYGF